MRDVNVDLIQVAGTGHVPKWMVRRFVYLCEVSPPSWHRRCDGTGDSDGNVPSRWSRFQDSGNSGRKAKCHPSHGEVGDDVAECQDSGPTDL